jgi:hypothetical protein
MKLFEPRHSPEDLLKAVKAVSEHASPSDPCSVTQNGFDAARVPAGYPDLPEARTICRRLKIKWRLVLETAWQTAVDPGQRLGTLSSDRSRKGITVQRIEQAAAQVAHSLQTQNLTRGAYSRERERIVAADRKAHLHGGAAAEALPSLNQVDGVLKKEGLTFEAVVALRGQVRVKGRMSRALPTAVMLGRFADAVGAMPRSKRQLERWASASGLSLKKPKGHEYADALAEVRGQRPDLPIAAAALDLSANLGERQDGDTPPSVIWTRERIVQGLLFAMKCLGLATTLTEARLKQLAPEHLGVVPSWAVVDRHAQKHGTSFPALRTEAADLWREERAVRMP